MRRSFLMTVSVLAAYLSCNAARAYEPPPLSRQVLKNVNFTEVVPLDEGYRLQFAACDGAAPSAGAKDTFRGHSLRVPGAPEAKQYYLCSRDPSNIKAMLKLKDGGIFWDSKMALDVDGSWAAWNGVPGATDLKETSYKWPNVADKRSREAQIDPDRIPFIVMPTDGLRRLTGAASGTLGREFSDKTGLQTGDMGVVVYRDTWTPVLIGDGGPFMRLGEGSSRVFEAIGQSRCKRWNADRTACVGTGQGSYPYKNFGIGRDVLFIAYPGTRSATATSDNAISLMCSLAKERLGLTGGAMCP